MNFRARKKNVAAALEGSHGLLLVTTEQEIIGSWLYVSAAQEMNRNRVCVLVLGLWALLKGWARHGLENALK
jgi:hypothetical protein